MDHMSQYNESNSRDSLPTPLESSDSVIDGQTQAALVQRRTKPRPGRRPWFVMSLLAVAFHFGQSGPISERSGRLSAADAPAADVRQSRLDERLVLDDAAVETRLNDDVTYLSSDELEGRGVQTRGLDLAADFIAEEFREAGLYTEHYEGTPFHSFRLYSMSRLGTMQEMAFDVPLGVDPELSPPEDFRSLTRSTNSRFVLPVVFAGYGITARRLGYDDYAELDVAGKAVIVLRHEPRQDDPESVFNGTENSDHAFVRTKIDNALDHGASLVIVCTDLHELELQAAADTDATDPDLDDYDELLDVELNESSLRGSIPVVHCRRAVVERLLRTVIGEDLSELEAQIDAEMLPQSRPLTGLRMSGKIALSQDGRTLRNVVASLEGEGPHAEETIIIGAHYDHLGRGGWGSLAIGANAEIHNGADDNASGTAILIELARQLAAEPQPLPRRIVFIAFSAEELGLIGSKRYTQDPLFPLDQTVAMLNLDMVGRLREDKLTVYGTGTAQQWNGMIDNAALPLSLEIRRRPGGYGPSDHASFFERGIPVLHFFTGFHSQYHRPSDDAELLNISGMRRITALVRELALGLARADSRPTPTSGESLLDYADLDVMQDALGFQIPDDRPLLGVVLEPVEGDGVLVKQLIRSTSAERHGIRPGDIIVSLDDEAVNTSDEIIERLKSYERGEHVTVHIVRGAIELELDVTL